MLPIYPFKGATLRRSAVLSAVVLSAVTAVSQAAPTPKKPAPKKPVAKAPAAKPKPKMINEVLGNVQLVGYEGALGQTYTVGKETAVNVTLKKAEYSVNRVNIGQYSYLPNGDEKFLVLHFTVHNPLKRPITYTTSYLTIKAVDANGITRDALSDVGREVTGESVNYPLQPAQKVDVYTAIKVAAFGEVPKLIVQNRYDDEAPIVRYDLRGKVAKMTAPFGDETGISAPRSIPAKMGVAYPVTDHFDLRVDKVGYTTDKLGTREPGDGNRYAYAIVTVTNRSLKPARYSEAYFSGVLKDADGEKTAYNGDLLKASRDEAGDAELAPGEEGRVRFYWKIPENVEAKTVLLQYGYDKESRVYAVEVVPEE